MEKNINLQNDIFYNIESGKKNAFFFFVKNGLFLKTQNKNFLVHEFFIHMKKTNGKEVTFKWTAEKREEFNVPILLEFDTYGNAPENNVRFALFVSDELVATNEDVKKCYIHFLLNINNGKYAQSVSLSVATVNGKKISSLICDGCPEINHFTKCICGF